MLIMLEVATAIGYKSYSEKTQNWALAYSLSTSFDKLTKIKKDPVV